MRSLCELLMFAAWICGVVLANGFWSTLISIVFPLWAYYLVAEKLLTQCLG